MNHIRTTKPDSIKQDTSKVVILDNQSSKTTKNTKDIYKEINAIERERERIRLEQANIISTIPAETNTNIQLEQNTNSTIQEQPDPSPNNPTPLYSLKSSTTSQEYKTPPVSPELDDISDLNSENLKELDETL